MKKQDIYFDNAASNPLHPLVLEKMLPYLKEYYGNASSVHSYGRKARVAIEEAREVIAGFINAKPGEIYFVSGGTEANNFPLLGMAKTNKSETGKNGIVISKAEHQCILQTAEELKNESFSLNYLSIDENSLVSRQELQNALNENTSLVSIIHVNNETAAVNEVELFAKDIKDKDILFHTDAVQSFGKIKIDVSDLKADAISFTAHKINGPKGIGATYIRTGAPAAPIIFGGSQERNRRGGTENVAAIVGFAEAVKLASAKMDDTFVNCEKIRNFIIDGIHSIDPKGIKINCPDSPFPYILSFTFSGKEYNNDSEAMLMYLDLNGIAASNGAACSSGTLKPSHVILNMGIPLEDAKGTIRLSFGYQNTIEEAGYFLEVLDLMARKFRL